MAGSSEVGDANAGSELVLVGAGHAHVEVLRSFAMNRPEDCNLTLVSPHSYATYSGMVPGFLAGQYDLREAQIDARALAARAGARFIAARASGIDASANLLQLDEHPPLPYDLLSLDIGSRPALAERIVDRRHTVEVKPIEIAAEQVGSALAEHSDTLANVVVVGAGPGGVEIAFAIARRLRDRENSTITVCDRAAEPASSRGPRTSRSVRKAFERHGIAFLGEQDVLAVEESGVRLASGRVLPADLVVWSTGAAAPVLFADAGLPLDPRGFLLIDQQLRVVDHEDIFAAGDCATIGEHPDLAKAGVYAVRQGPVLANNLRAAITGRSLRTFKPQRRFLSLLNTAHGKAIVSYGSFALRSRAGWWLKDRIDRRFIERYARPALGPPDESMGPMQPCGGCAAKIGADVLERVLSRLDVPHADHVVLGVDSADDAAAFTSPDPARTLSVTTTDLFPPFTGDLHLASRIAAVSAASDLYACGAEGAAAVAIVSVGSTDPRRQEADLDAMVRGALSALGEMNIPLVGGHSIAHEGTLIGFSMHGYAAPDQLLRKSGARTGDALVLSKPLGTGVILAAAGMGAADSDWVEGAYASMLRSNGPMMRLLLDHGAHACTDVTGFGLAGHLGELARSSGVTAELDSGRVPALAGAAELLAAGWRSSFHTSNERATTNALPALLNDPQTSGGLLAALPADQLDGLLAAAAAAGEELYVVGRCAEESDRPLRVTE